MGVELNKEQIYACFEMESWWHKANDQTFEISGAAGTGKTTLVLYLIQRLGLSMDEVLFVAYMGKAASQLSRHGLPAKTCHSAIYQYEKVIARDEHGKIITKENGKPVLIGKFIKKERVGKRIRLMVLDEASMANEELSKDLLSYGIPLIALGDLNQLAPVFGNSYFLKNPDVILRQIMRQNEGNPIIWLSQQVLADKKLNIGSYGTSTIMYKEDLTDDIFKNSDIILSSTNRLRNQINIMFRERFRQYKNLQYPYVGEKVICKKNNWGKSVDENIFLTNGTTGTIDFVSRESYDKKSITIDFKPDFTKSVFRNLKISYDRLMSYNGMMDPNEALNPFDFMDKFEFAYAITAYASQGSQWDNVLMLDESMPGSKEDEKKRRYTEITRASKSIIIGI